MSRSTQQIIEDSLARYQPSYRIEPDSKNTISVRRSEKNGNYELTHNYFVEFSEDEEGGPLTIELTDASSAVWVNSQNTGLEDGMKLEGFKLVKRT